MAKNINFDELRFLRENGLHILKIWISREEGYEYQLLPLGASTSRGDCVVLAFRKSPRACFNYAKRHLTKRALDFCPACLNTGYRRVSPTILAKCSCEHGQSQ